MFSCTGKVTFLCHGKQDIIRFIRERRIGIQHDGIYNETISDIIFNGGDLGRGVRSPERWNGTSGAFYL